VDILWGFENISLPWEYLPKDYKHLIRLENYSCALGNIYKRTTNISWGFQTVPRP